MSEERELVKIPFTRQGLHSVDKDGFVYNLKSKLSSRGATVTLINGITIVIAPSFGKAIFNREEWAISKIAFKAGKNNT